MSPRLGPDTGASLGAAEHTNTSNGLVDASGAAELLGFPKSWVLAEARADRIPHVRLGRYVRFEAAQLEAWWRGRRQGPMVTAVDGNAGRPPARNGRSSA